MPEAGVQPPGVGPVSGSEIMNGFKGATVDLVVAKDAVEEGLWH